MNVDDFFLASDISRIQSGGKSLTDKLYDAATAGTAGAVTSGLLSLYNTGVAVANVFGAEAEEIKTAEVLGDIDANWKKYYEENAQVIDTIGFIGGSFIPGLTALKGLQLARAGKAAGTYRGVLGYTINKQNNALKRGLDEIAQTGGTVFSRINTNKLSSMAWGTADNVLQTAVFETAAAATMHSSPFFAGDSAGDIAWDVVKTSLAGGFLGGAVEALFTNKIFRDAGKLVDKGQRKYDTVVALDNLNMNFGDKVFGIIDELEKLPNEVLQADKKLKFSYRLNGRVEAVDLDTGALYDKKLQETTRRAMQTIQAKIVDSVTSDSTVGAAVAESIADIMREGITTASKTAAKEKLGSFLLGLKRMEGMVNPEVNFTKETFYIPEAAAKGEVGKVDFASLFSPFKKADTDRTVEVIGNAADAKMVILGPDVTTVKQAWEQGYDIAMTAEGKVSINPGSGIFRTVPKEDTRPTRAVFNTRSKTTSDSAIGTIADVQTPESTLVVKSKAGIVESGKFQYKFTLDSFDPVADATKATARHLWAASLEGKLSNVTIGSYDFSILDRLAANPSMIGDGVKIKNFDDTITVLSPGDAITDQVIALKRDYLIRTLGSVQAHKQQIEHLKELGDEIPIDVAKAAEDIDLRLLAYRTNTELSWITDALGHEFDITKMRTPEAMRPLESYAARENIVMVYDPKIKAQLMEGDFPDALVAYEERKAIALQKSQEAFASVMKEDADKFIDFQADTLNKKFDATGVGATGFGFSNADYGDLGRLWAQDVGKQASLITVKRTNSTLEQLQSSAADVVADSAAGRELATILTRVRRSDELLTMVPGKDAAGNDIMKVVDLATVNEIAKLQAKGKPLSGISYKVDIPMSQKVSNFMLQHHEIHRRQLGEKIELANAQGTTLHWNPNALYVPPIDTRKVPYFAFVREAEGKAFGTSEVAMITARSPEELQRLTEAVPKEYQVIFKKDTELYHKAMGDYNYSRALNQPTLDPFLRKKGVLGDFLPSLDGKAAIEDFISYHMRKEEQIVRDAIEVKYSQTFAELKWLSDQNTLLQTSKYGYQGKQSVRTIADPFDDYRKTALNISKKAEYTLWQNLNEFVDALGTRAYRATEDAMRDAQAGKITWEEANKLMEKVGLGGPFTSQESFLAAQVGNDRNYIKQAIAKGNMLLSTVGLRLDWANSLINIISTPILLSAEMSSIRSAVRGHSELAGKINELFTVVDPGTKMPVPTTRKLLMRAVANYWTPEGKALVAGRYKDIGAIKDVLSMHHSMMSDLALTPDMVPRKWAERVGNWTEKASTITGNNFSEQFTRFVSADVMRQVTDPLVAAGKMSAKEQNAYISIFVNRVQGNYISSQRPIAFQGTLGSAIGLFQTYQFNLFQQLFRHIENRDARAIATMGGMQTSVFGLNGLPLFEAVNTQLIGQANINEGHHDAYSFAVQAAGKEWGDWLMYGSASAFPIFSDKMPALYSRGDLNPRHVSIIPTSPMQVPIVEAGSRVVSNLINLGKSLGNDSPMASNLLFGMEHNGISRPMAGIAQVLQGFSTTSKGSLIGQSSDFSAIATASRVLGSRPMDEAVALSAKYRLEGYRAADRDRIEALGIAVKEKIRSGTLTSEDILDLQGRYAQVGGRIDTFGAALQRWQKGATQSVVNAIADSQKTAYGQRLNEIMGADRLEDTRYQ